MNVPAPELGAIAIKSALAKSGVPPDRVSDVYMGNVLSASMGQSPARQASMLSGLSPTIDAVTINKVCSSGLKAVVFAAQNIQLGLAEAQIAGGMENMSRVPYYMNRANQHPPFGDLKMEDGLIKDGLWDVYNQIHMGVCAEQTAKKYKVSREEQDEYAISSYKRAQRAWAAGEFIDEVVPVTVKGKKGETVVSKDDGYDNLQEDKIPTLKPAFVKNGGTVTAANSSSLNDGASALVLGSREIAVKYGKGNRVLARIVASADAAVDPIDFPVAPAKAVPIALERAGITKDQVAVWEFNEAFAAVIKANQKVSAPLSSSFSNVFRSTLLLFITNSLVDTISRFLQCQSSRWCHRPWSCTRELGLSDSHHPPPPAAARAVWGCSHLQWGWSGYRGGRAKRRIPLTLGICGAIDRCPGGSSLGQVV